MKNSSVANPLFEGSPQLPHSRVADFRQGGVTPLYADADFQYLRNLVPFGFTQYTCLQNTESYCNTHHCNTRNTSGVKCARAGRWTIASLLLPPVTSGRHHHHHHRGHHHSQHKYSNS